MRIIERAKVRGERGKWWPIFIASEHRHSASIVCPACGQAMTIVNHSIAPDGSVGPSVVCPYVECPNERCGWHEVIQLGDWPPRGDP